MAAALRPGNVQFMLRALRYRNYRLFFGGQLISLLGTWLTMVATNWLVYRLANATMPQRTAVILGIVGFVGQIPMFLCAPLAGVWVDRWNRHRILIVTQILSMIQSFTLAVLALANVITIPHVVVLNALQGIVNSFDIPARQALIVDLVEQREDLSNAIALSSSMVHAARFLGPAAAGLLIYYFGEGICFLIDGFSYLAVVTALAMMRVRPLVLADRSQRAFHALQEGIGYAFGFPPIRALLVLVAITSLATMSQSVLMPLFVNRVLGGGERALGLLLGASGMGALAGSFYLASRRSVLGLGRVIVAACGLLGVGLIAFSTSRSLWIAMPLLTVTGGAMVVQMASANTVLQTMVDDEKRGRVMSLFAMAFLGMAPFGSMLAGMIATALGAPATLMLSGFVCVAAATVFGLRLPALREMVRPIYVRKGILPEVATGIQSTATLAASSPE